MPTPYLHMRRSLQLPFAAPVLVAGTTFGPWHRDHARAVHALLRSAYALGGGSVAAYGPWHKGFEQDNEFAAEACVLAFRAGALLGAALCWNNGFIKDLCVAREYRRQGLATAMLVAVFKHFQQQGRSCVELKVQRDNPSGAQRLYEQLGFRMLAER
jgi:ribosomal protein S18 acetylase RimI-like enzyme